MTPLLEQALKTGNDDYDGLPAAIRADLTLNEWLWLSDYDKATLVQRMCEPEE